MNYQEYKKIINNLIEKLDESDFIFIKQIYTIINRYLRKRGR